MSFLDPVDVLKLWPNDQKALLDSKKWSERRDSLECLLELLGQYSSQLSPTADYSDLCKSLKKTIQGDSNINVVALTVKVVGALATGLGTRFEPFVGLLAPALFDKFKEKKEVLKKPLIECVDCLSLSCTNMEKLLPAMLDVWQQKPNPNVKIQLNWLIYRMLYRLNTSIQSPPVGFLKAIMPVIAKQTEEGDPDVRDSAFAAMGSTQRLLGEAGLKTFAASTLGDPNKAKKISTYCESATEKAEEYRIAMGEVAGANVVNGGQENGAETSEKTVDAQNNIDGVGIDPWEMLEAVNVIEKLPADFSNQLASKAWAERRDALQVLLTLLEQNPKLVGDTSLYKELVTQIVKMLEKDTNINVCALAAKCMKAFAEGLRFQFSDFTSIAISACVEKFKEKKSVLQEPLAACADAIAMTTSIAEYTEKAVVGLTKPNPTVKQQTALFLNRLFKKHNSKTCPAAAVKELSATLTKLGSDADPEVRNATFLAIAAIMRCTGQPIGESLFAGVIDDGMKKAKILEEYQKLLAELGNKADPLILKLHANSQAPSSQSNATQKPSAASSRISSAQKPSATVRRVNSSASAHTTRPIASGIGAAAVVSQPAKPKSATPARVTSATSSHPPSTSTTRPIAMRKPMGSGQQSARQVSAASKPTVNVVPKQVATTQRLSQNSIKSSPPKQNGNAVKEVASVLARSIPAAPGAVSGGSRISRPPSSSCLAAMAKADSGQVTRSTSSVGTSRIPRLGSRPTTPSNRLS